MSCGYIIGDVAWQSLSSHLPQPQYKVANALIEAGRHNYMLFQRSCVMLCCKETSVCLESLFSILDSHVVSRYITTADHLRQL